MGFSGDRFQARISLGYEKSLEHDELNPLLGRLVELALKLYQPH
jgi:hypothetical protein